MTQTKVYQTVSTLVDVAQFQDSPDISVNWTSIWKMLYNLEKNISTLENTTWIKHVQWKQVKKGYLLNKSIQKSIWES